MGRQPEVRDSEDGVRHATINGHRFHLRMHADHQQHLLWIDGRQPPLLLDTTAARFTAHLIDAMWEFQRGDGDESSAVTRAVVERMYREYSRPWAFGSRRVTRERITADLHRVFGTLMQVAEGACPAEMGLPAQPISYGQWTAPARMDLAITYRCNLRCGKCYLPETYHGQELSTAQWKAVLETLWRLGIPQVVFTGGEPTLRGDLLDLLPAAERFVTGLVTNGTRLAQLAASLRDASLDYVQVTIESDDPQVHDRLTGVQGSHAETTAGIRQALARGLEVVTNTTLTSENGSGFVRMLGWLHEMGVRHIACNTVICSGRGARAKTEQGLDDRELQPILRAACVEAERLGVELQWYSPTCYGQGINPLELGFGAKSCSAAAHNMTVQPDGSVLPCQSWPEAVGNLLTDNWTAIWEHPTCLALRQHARAPEGCAQCSFAGLCGGGCPLDNSPRLPVLGGC